MGTEIVLNDSVWEEINIAAWRDIVLRRNADNKKEVHRSFYYSLGAECLDAGSIGLGSLSRYLASQGNNEPLFVGSESLKSMNKSIQTRFLDDYAKVAGGIILMGADHILAGEDDLFSDLTFCNWHNESVDRTFVTKLKQGGANPYPTQQDRKEMLKIHKEDETNLSFIGPSIKALPLFAQENLQAMGITATLEDRIRPFLMKVANEIRPFQNARRSIFSHKFSLAHYNL